MRQSSANTTRSVALLSGLIIGSFVLLVSVALPEGNSTLAAVQNFGHFILFAFLGWTTLPITNRILRENLPLAVCLTGVGLMLLGVGVELFQTGLANRSASVSDFVLDVAGIVAGFLAYALLRFLRQGRIYSGVACGGMLIFIAAFALKPLVPLIGFDLLRPGLPIVRSFDYPFANQKIESVGGATFEISRGLSTQCCVLRVTFSPARFSGVIFEENGFRAGKWSEFMSLNIKFFSSLPNTRQISLRIDDRLHNNLYSDRYNGVLSISPGLNELSIPLQHIASMGRADHSGRRMDIDDITRVQIFASEVENPFTLDLLSVELR